jgi:ATP-binding cassette subfamily F protein 3
MSFDAPHLLLLDEPTNHLDIEAREALVQTLNDYEGAIVIVSHDPSMVERVADRLWLVRDSKVVDFEGDLEDYRQFIIQAKRDERKKERAQKAKVEASATPAVVSEKRKLSHAEKQKIDALEKTIARLTAEKDALDALLADPSFYTSGKNIVETQQNYTKVVRELGAKEAEWLELV